MAKKEEEIVTHINYAWKDVQLFVGQKGKSLNLKQSHEIFSLIHLFLV